MDFFISKLEKLSPSLATVISPYLEEIRETTHFAVALGVTRPIILLPLMLYQDSYFKDGIYFEVVRRKRRTDVMASGGR
jgi:eukaryotic translation initiation factor 2-alpha kinase 4